MRTCGRSPAFGTSTLLGQYVTAQFTKASDGHGGTLVGDPPVVAQTDHQSIGLVNPHA
jgi:hypothetical protein